MDNETIESVEILRFLIGEYRANETNQQKLIDSLTLRLKNTIAKLNALNIRLENAVNTIKENMKNAS